MREIVQAAKHLSVDLIVIGSYGCTGPKQLLLGSTAERVVEHQLFDERYSDMPRRNENGSRGRSIS
jgi:Universal stress protein family